MITLYYNLGSSDAKVDDAQRFDSYYESIQSIYDQIKNKIEHLTFKQDRIQVKENASIEYPFRNAVSDQRVTKPLHYIGFPLLSKLIVRLIRDNKKPAKIYLFATQQSPVHKKDTYYLAYLMKIFLIKKFKINTENIHVKEISDNPSDYTKMITYYSHFMNTISDEPDQQLYNITQLSAGTPAMNFSLSHLLMNKPGALFYYIPDEENKEAYEDITFNELNKRNHLETIKTLITNYDYNGAIKVIKNSPFKNNQVLIKVLSFLNQRKNFNITNETLNNDIRYISDNEEEFFPSIFNDAYNLLNQDLKYTYTEFYYQIDMHFKMHIWTVSIALIFSLFDNLMQHLVEQLLNIQLDDIKRGESEKLKKEIQNIPELNNKIQHQALNKAKPSLVVLNIIINYFKGNKMADIFINNYEKFECFQEVRNKGPFGHGTKGISKEYIEEKYGDTIQNIIKNLGLLLNELNLLNDTFSYNRYNKQIIEYMEKIGKIKFN